MELYCALIVFFGLLSYTASIDLDCAQKILKECTDDREPVCGINDRKEKVVFLNKCFLKNALCFPELKTYYKEIDIERCVGVENFFPPDGLE